MTDLVAMHVWGKYLTKNHLHQKNPIKSISNHLFTPPQKVRVVCYGNGREWQSTTATQLMHFLLTSCANLTVDLHLEFIISCRTLQGCFWLRALRLLLLLSQVVAGALCLVVWCQVGLLSKDRLLSGSQFYRRSRVAAYTWAYSWAVW